MKWTAEDFAREIGEFRRRVAGVARRLTVRMTESGVWMLAGHILFDDVRETREVELWPGIGFFARPPRGDTAEAVVLNLGGQNNPAIVATRDEATRTKVDDLAEDETALFNSAARVHVKANGTIEARTHTGTAVALATKADVDALAAYVAKQFATSGTGHTHTLASGGTVTLTTVPTGAAGTGSGVPAAAGTQKLKGE